MIIAVKRFWLHVDKQAECWLWTGALNEYGYGQFGVWTLKPSVKLPKIMIRERTTGHAHRISWEIHHGPVPDGLQVLHNCDAHYPAGDWTNRRCVNPAHLYLGTQAENMQRMVDLGRARRCA
jgi:hypothetical protein